MKQIIRLTESDLHKLVKESVQKIINELEGGCWDNESLWHSTDDDEEEDNDPLTTSKAWKEDHMNMK